MFRFQRLKTDSRGLSSDKPPLNFALLKREGAPPLKKKRKGNAKLPAWPRGAF